MKTLLALIRWPNLVLVAIIQTIVFLRLLDGQRSLLSTADVFFLILITVLLAAGGYVINDYYDRDIDKINKPDNWIAGNHWSLKAVLHTYRIITIAGALLSIGVAIHLQLIAYILLYPLAAAGLWWYSAGLKCKPVAGNLWVSLFCAGVVMIIALPDIIKENSEVISIHLWYYALFAFLSTWYREVIKDIEDVEGDRQQGCQTMVVRFGISNAKILSAILGAGLITTMIFWENEQLSSVVKWFLLILRGMILASIAFTWWAKNKSYYHTASTLTKIVMLCGTLLLLLID